MPILYANITVPRISDLPDLVTYWVSLLQYNGFSSVLPFLDSPGPRHVLRSPSHRSSSSHARRRAAAAVVWRPGGTVTARLPRRYAPAFRSYPQRPAGQPSAPGQPRQPRQPGATGLSPDSLRPRQKRPLRLPAPYPPAFAATAAAAGGFYCRLGKCSAF